MKITIFGAAGAIGRLAVRAALEKGWEATAFARHASRIEPRTGLAIIQAELTDQAAVERALRGSAAAVTAFGPGFGRLPDDWLPLTEGVKTIVGAMRRLGMKRLIVLATPSMPAPEDEPVFRARVLPWLIRRLLPDAYREIIGMCREAMQTDLDWTIVRQILPRDFPPRGVVSGFMDRKTRYRVSRTDAARFLVDQVTDSVFIRRLPVIFSKR